MFHFSERESGLLNSRGPGLSSNLTLVALHTALGWLSPIRKYKCLFVDLSLPLSTGRHPLGGGPWLVNERVTSVPAPSVGD